MEGNTVTPVISASDIGTITSSLTSQVSTIAPALLGLMAVPLGIFLVRKIINKFSGAK